MPPQNCNLSVHKMMCLCVSIWMLFKLILLFALSINEHVIRNQSDAKTLQQLQSWTQHENSKQNIRTHTKKKTKRYTATAKAWVYVYGCIELCSVQFYVSSESSECQRTRDKGNFHEHKKSQQQWQLQQKKEKKAKFFNGTVKYIMQSRRFILCMRKKSSLPVLYTRIDRQSGDAPTVVVDCWSTHAEPTKQPEQMKSGKRKSRAHDDKRICDIIIGLRGKLAPRKSISLTQREKNVAKIHVYTYGQHTSGMVFSRSLCVQDAKSWMHIQKKRARADGMGVRNAQRIWQ